MLAKKTMLCWLLMLLLPLLPLHALLAGGAPVVAQDVASMHTAHDHGSQDQPDCPHCASHDGGQHMADADEGSTCHDDGCAAMGHCCAACPHALPVVSGAVTGFVHVFPSPPSYGADLPHEIKPPRLHA